MTAQAINDPAIMATLPLIKRFEGFSARPYRCPAGVWTIGYGTTILPSGISVSSSTDPLTREEAEEMVKETLRSSSQQINQIVKVPLTTSQKAALLDFTYNLGFSRLRSSTLLKKLNESDYHGASDEFMRWNKSGNKVLPGLTRRREAERAIFLGENV